MRTGTARLPLHSGKAPRWLMKRMAVLGREIVLLMASEFGTATVLERLANPFWFQALGCVLGFDWHSSGVTTTVTGALKEGLAEAGGDIGLYACGGKGAHARRTPDEIRQHGERLGVDIDGLIHASRTSAKIDNAALQDGYQLYHHAFFFDRTGRWCVVQQGMADERDALGRAHAGFARRYHWLGVRVSRFEKEPHQAICSESRGQLVLNLVARESACAQSQMVSLMDQPPEALVADVNRLPSLVMEARHAILARDISPKRLKSVLLKTYDRHPGTFLELLNTEGVGPKTLRALALGSELVYGRAPSYRDPARFSFAHGGKDGIPYPVDRAVYAQSIETLRGLLDRTKVDVSEKRRAFRRLSRFASA